MNCSGINCPDNVQIRTSQFFLFISPSWHTLTSWPRLKTKHRTRLDVRLKAYVYTSTLCWAVFVPQQASLGVDTDRAFICFITSAISHSSSLRVFHAWAQRALRFVISYLKLEVSLCDALHTLLQGCHTALTTQCYAGGHESHHYRGEKSDMKIRCWREVSGIITVVSEQTSWFPGGNMEGKMSQVINFRPALDVLYIPLASWIKSPGDGLTRRVAQQSDKCTWLVFRQESCR